MMVDGTENKSGALCYYTDLQFKTGTQTTNQRFYLSDLGDHKAIFGYPWFAAFQPKVDLKRGWIDMSQLPIVLSAPNAAKASYTPRTKNVPCPIKRAADQYFLGQVTMGSVTTNEPNTAAPEEYRRHNKVFSESKSQRLPLSTIWDHAIELLPGAPNTLPERLLPLTQEEKSEMHKFVQEHLKMGTIHISKSPYAAKWTKKNRNVSPLIPQVIDHLSGCTKYTIMDICWGYNNICIKEWDKGKAALLTHEGLFEHTIMFFGLTNSPATFYIMMNTIFQKEVGEGWLSVYMDDIAIHTAKHPHETE